MIPLFFACSTPEDSAVETPTDDGFEALAGAVFVQEGQEEGYASYSFAAADDVHIDYSAIADQFTLDSGAALPEHKAFVDHDYTGALSFRAVIDWSVPEGSTLGGDELWRYTMVFDEAYSEIASGTIEAYDAEGELTYILNFGADMRYVRAE